MNLVMVELHESDALFDKRDMNHTYIRSAEYVKMVVVKGGWRCGEAVIYNRYGHTIRRFNGHMMFFNKIRKVK